ncbi:hypothetical protein B2A_15546, partial [mine drainage metagenome]
HVDQPHPVPARSVDDRVHAPVRHRDEVLPRLVPLALAAWLPLPGLWRPPTVALSPRSADVLPVPILPSSDDAAQRHDLRSHQAAAAHLAVGHPPVDCDQDEHGGAGVEAPSRGGLQSR